MVAARHLVPTEKDATPSQVGVHSSPNGGCSGIGPMDQDADHVLQHPEEISVEGSQCRSLPLLAARQALYGDELAGTVAPLAGEQGRARALQEMGGLTAQVAKYEWEIDPLDVKGPTIHGLRGTGCSPGGRTATTPTRSRTTSACRGRWWNHYMRFGDQMEVAAEGRKRLRLVGSTTDRDDRI
jgi:hypothetical protein